MSYVRSRIARMKKRPRGHGGFAAYGDITDCSPLDPMCFVNQTRNMSDDACSQQADTDVAPIDAIANDLDKNWKLDSDYVAPTDLRSAVDQVMVMEKSGRDAISAAMAQAPETQKDLLYQMMSNMDGIGAQAGNYYAAANSAQAAGTAVAAPGLKKWVVSSFDKVSSAVHASSVVLCQLPSWLAYLQAITTAAQAVAAVCKKIASVVIAVGEKAITAVEEGLDMIAVIEKIAPYAAVGLAAWWLFLREKKRKAKAA